MIHLYNRSSYKYRPLKARINIKMFSIKCLGPRFFNSLPVTLVNMPRINQFKTALKRYLADMQNIYCVNGGP